jgi:hypothetical protein
VHLTKRGELRFELGYERAPGEGTGLSDLDKSINEFRHEGFMLNA